MKVNKVIDKTEKPKRSIGSKILMGITFFFFGLTIFVLISGTISIKNNRPFTIFGYTYSVVPTPSMEPNIHVNDIVFAKTVPYEELTLHEEGEQDIIIYYDYEKGIFIVHRIHHFDDEGIITKGDNNSTADTVHVTKDNYIAKVVWHGNFLNLGKIVTNGRNVIFLIIIIIFVVIFLNEVFNIVKIKNEKENEKKKEQMKNEEENWKENLRKEVLEEIEKENETKDSTTK